MMTKAPNTITRDLPRKLGESEIAHGFDFYDHIHPMMGFKIAKIEIDPLHAGSGDFPVLLFAEGSSSPCPVGYNYLEKYKPKIGDYFLRTFAGGLAFSSAEWMDLKYVKVAAAPKV